MNKEVFLQKAQEYIGFEQDPFFRDQVVKLVEEKNFTELSDRFYTELEFGTGGLRGVIGGGYNRMNPFVVRKSTQGLANYIKKSVPAEEASAVIAFDSRNFSDLLHWKRLWYFALMEYALICSPDCVLLLNFPLQYVT